MKKSLTLIALLVLLATLAACSGTKNDGNIDGEKGASAQDTPKPAQANVVVQKDSFPENTVIQVEAVKDDTRVKSILTTAQSVEIYDINALLNNEKVQPSEKVEVTFPIPADYDSDKHIIELYYISDDGTCEKIDATVIDDAVVACLEHFSVYVVAVLQKPSFILAIDTEAGVLDGEKALLSDNKVSFVFNPGDTWKTFAEKNKSAGFLIDKDFYGKKDLVFYEYNGTREQVVVAVGLYEVTPDDKIEEKDYACMIPHRETLQGQWFYEVSNEPFTVEGYSEPFDRQGKTIIIDTNEMTYTIKHIKLQKITALSFVANEKIIASGKYTSDDGDTLGATLTFDNGYVIKTSRSKSFEATLLINGRSIDAKTADKCDFYDFN